MKVLRKINELLALLLIPILPIFYLTKLLPYNEILFWLVFIGYDCLIIIKIFQKRLILL